MKLQLPLRESVLFAIAAVVVALAAGCGNNPVAPGEAQSMDAGLVAQTLALTPTLTDDDLSGSDSQGANPARAREAQGPMSAINPLTFWRTITGVGTTFDIAFSDSVDGRPTRALVTVHKRLLGRFNVAATQSPDDGRVFQKPLDDAWTRHVRLERNVAPVSDPEWRVTAVSGVNVVSNGAATHIASLRIRAGGQDVTITDPLEFFALRQVLRFDSQDSVRVTVTTLRDDDVVLLHVLDRRVRLAHLGGNSYETAWMPGGLAGWRHFGVDALSRGTLYDDQLPYDSNRWHLPFVIASEPVVDYYP